MAGLDKTSANKKLLQDFIDVVLLGGQFDKVAQYISVETYHQHNPGVGDGLAGFGQAMEEMAKAGLTMKYAKVHRVLGEGNFVFTHSEGEFGGKRVAFADLFRIEASKIVEHWDAVQEIPATAVNANSMF